MPGTFHRTDEPPPGFTVTADFLSEEEERALLGAMETIAFSLVEMRGVVARREAAHFGVLYGYESRETRPGPPIPEFLRALCDRAAALGVFTSPVDELLVTRYPPGAGIGWHRDAPMFGGVVVGVSLGAACTFRFRHRVDGELVIYRTTLPPRSGYVLGGAARASWQHSIPPVESTRYSLTFRTLRRR